METPFKLAPTGSAYARWQRAQGLEPTFEAAWLEAVVTRAALVDRGPELVHLAWELACWAPPPVRPAVHLLALVALVDLSDGSTRTPTVDRPAFRLRLASLAPPDANAIATALRLLDEPRLGAPVLTHDPAGPAALIVREGSLQLERMTWLEGQLADRLWSRATRVSTKRAEEADRVLATLRHEKDASVARLTDEQARAVVSAASRGLTVVTGGPGTGKTSIVVALLSVLERLHARAPIEVALAAPTGKATHRLSITVRERLKAPAPRTETLHRLLGAKPGKSRFAHHSGHPLPVRLLVVDEASMLDLELAARLVDALEPSAQLILLGDADQLPSVDAGAVLGELVRSLPAGAVCRLTQSFRMDSEDSDGRAVLEAARALQRGDPETFLGLARAGGPVRFRRMESERERDAFLREWLARGPLGDPAYRAAVRRVERHAEGRFVEEDAEVVGRILAAASSTQLLTVTRQRSFPRSSEALSRALHILFAQQEGLSEEQPFLRGEPVIMQRNDYERRLFNGDIGVVLSVARDREAARPMAVFAGQDGPEAFDLAPLVHDLALAHAITVHRAQGSEYERVALVLPERDVPLLTREILYTAATRARRSVEIAGAPALLEQGLARRINREMGLGERLKQVMHPSREDPPAE